MDKRGLLSDFSGPVVDPFFAFREELLRKLDKCKRKFEDWKALLDGTNTASSNKFTSLNSSLLRDVDNVAKELNHLERIAVKQVERQRKNFDSISDEDLQSRKDFVRTTRRTLRDIKETMTGAATKAKMTQDKQSLLGIGRNDVEGSEGSSSSKWGGGASNSSGLSNSEFLTSERSQQGALMEKQDEMLDVLSSHVVQLNAMGTEIGTELDDQKRLLEDFDGELTKTQQRMEKVIGKMQDLLQTSNNGTLCLIVVLVIIAAVEFLLIMYT